MLAMRRTDAGQPGSDIAPALPFKLQKEEEEEEAEVVRRGVRGKKPQCLVKACSLTQSLSLSASQGAR